MKFKRFFTKIGMAIEQLLFILTVVVIVILSIPSVLLGWLLYQINSGKIKRYFNKTKKSLQKKIFTWDAPARRM